MKMGFGGDDTADCLRYLVATKSRVVAQRKLRGPVNEAANNLVHRNALMAAKIIPPYPNNCQE